MIEEAKQKLVYPVGAVTNEEKCILYLQLSEHPSCTKNTKKSKKCVNKTYIHHLGFKYHLFDCDDLFCPPWPLSWDLSEISRHHQWLHHQLMRQRPTKRANQMEWRAVIFVGVNQVMLLCHRMAWSLEIFNGCPCTENMSRFILMKRLQIVLAQRIVWTN